MMAMPASPGAVAMAAMVSCCVALMLLKNSTVRAGARRLFYCIGMGVGVDVMPVWPRIGSGPGRENPLIVCLDIQSAVTQRAGVGRYTRSLAEALVAQAGADRLRLFCFDFRGRAEVPAWAGAETRVVRWCPGRVAQKAWARAGWPPFDGFAGPADVFHFPNFIRPPLARGRSVVTIHDLAFLRMPETLEDRNRAYLRAQIGRTVARADLLIAVSEFTAREMQMLLDLEPGRIRVTGEGLGPEWLPPAPEAVRRVRAQYRLDRPYLLTVGTFEPRKNLPFLVEAFERLAGFDGDLVMAGRLGWHYEPILERIEQSPQAARIRCLHDVDEEALPALYGGAELFVFPSRYEGFGFTPLEAMACGVPVLAAVSGALPETLGAAAAWAEEFAAEAWAADIRRLLSDTAARADLCARGLEQARKHTWAEAARKTWAVYRELGPASA